mgnify:CR=1 FL=1
MTSDGRPFNLTRRGFLRGAAAAAVAPPWLAACGGDEEEATPTTAAPEEVGAPATTVLEEPDSALAWIHRRDGGTDQGLGHLRRLRTSFGGLIPGG